LIKIKKYKIKIFFTNRALQIYYTHGLTKSELIETKNNVKNDFQVPLRYKNVCLFALNCQTESDNDFNFT